MSKPTEDELKHALGLAAHMRESGRDPHHLAKSLLHLSFIFKHLENVRHAADLYVKFGQGETEHRELVRALEACRVADEQSEHGEHTEFGLD